jgi:hypothetical protein
MRGALGVSVFALVNFCELETEMTPKSFDIDTAKEIVGDARMRTIEAKARQDADNNIMDKPVIAEGNYWDGVQSSMEYVVYITAHHKRMERIQRMKERKNDDTKMSA